MGRIVDRDFSAGVDADVVPGVAAAGGGPDFLGPSGEARPKIDQRFSHTHMARLLRVAMVDMLSELILFLSRSVSHTV